MSSNLNWNAIPTKKTVETTKQVLQEIEKQLEETLKSVANLRQQIAEYKAWIAPIRKVSEEALSITFVNCARDYWQSPLILGAVCRRWRRILLKTPGAWAFLEENIQEDCNFHYQLLNLWISRCGGIKLRLVGLLSSAPEFIDAVCRHPRNLQSLSLYDNPKQLKRSFPELEELHIDESESHTTKPEANETMKKPGDKKEYISLLSFKRFPKLLSLHLHLPCNATMQAIAQRSLFPPLQTLHIHTSGAHWLQIIDLCANTLITLVIEKKLDKFCTVLKQEPQNLIELPRLQRLAYLGRRSGMRKSDFILPSFQTPVLQSYKEVAPEGTSPMHKDLSSVTCLDISHDLPMLSPAVTSLKIANLQSVLHFRLRAPHTILVLNVLQDLEESPETCPYLSLMECFFRDLPSKAALAEAKAKSLMQSRVNRCGRLVKVRYFSLNDYYLEAPTVKNYHDCFSFCECNSPGHPQQDMYHKRCDEYELDPTSLDSEHYSEGILES